MQSKHFAAFTLALALGSAPALAAPAQPVISMSAARAIALKARPGGKIVAQELENEGGGRRYSFDIKLHGTTYEVGVDAKTGKVLENKVEGKNPD